MSGKKIKTSLQSASQISEKKTNLTQNLMLIYNSVTLTLVSSSIKVMSTNLHESGVRSAMCAASQLPARGPIAMDDAPIPACSSKIR